MLMAVSAFENRNDAAYVNANICGALNTADSTKRTRAGTEFRLSICTHVRFGNVIKESTLISVIRMRQADAQESMAAEGRCRRER